MTRLSTQSATQADDDRGHPYRVMLVDDSATVRGLMRNWLGEQPDIKVIASCANGLQAIQNLETYKPEIIILDIEMPVMDGITALPELRKAAPNVTIIIASTLSTQNAKISLKALSMGAADYITKPDSSRGLAGSDEYKRSLFERIRTFGEKGRLARGEELPDCDEAAAAKAKHSAERALQANKKPRPASSFTLKEPSRVKPKIIAIGSSTGGPQALYEVFKGLNQEKLPPVVITQHMPKTFTTILAEHLAKTTGLTCYEAKQGQSVRAGEIYIAPGDYHMVVTGSVSAPKLELNQSAPENFCRPSVDPMFRSVSKLYGKHVLSVMLTGMGADGLGGTRDVVDGGGTMIAQDEETSVVWGMPGAVAQAGLCAQILPLSGIASEIKKYL